MSSVRPSMQWIYAAVLLLLGSVWCQNEIPEDLQDLEKHLGEVPGFENFNQSAVPSIEEVQDAIKEKCEKNGGPDAYEKLGTAKDDLQACIMSNFNFTQIQKELDESRKTGSMEEVFAKYCLKRAVVQECVKNMTLTVEPCLEEEEKSSLKLLLNITDSLATFVCYKDGDRIAMFVAEGGFECLQSKKEGLEQCANQTFSHRIPSDFSLNALPSLVIDDQGCDDYTKLQSCVVGVLETCEDNTPANIVDALFKFIRKITPCKSRPTPASVLGARLRTYRSNANPAPLEDAYNQLKQKYEPHCLKHGGQKALDEFHNAAKDADKCQKAAVMNFKNENAKSGGISYPYMCNTFRPGLRYCLANLTSKIQACSSPAEAYVPKFGLDLYDSVFEFYCKEDARALKKFFKEGDPCMNKVHNSIGICIDKTKHIKNYASAATVVTKSELCGDLKLLRNCVLDVAAQQCPNPNSVNEFVVGLGDAIYAPCTGCRMLVTNFLLLLIFLLLTKCL